MKVQLKRIGAMIIAIIMVVSLIPLNISAEESQVLEISDFSIKINEEGINLVAISEGGVGNYQYQFYQKQKSSLEDKIILSEYSDKNSYTYANPLQGEYIFGVEVKDESGRSVSEEKNITYENEIEKVEEEISEELIFPNEGLTDNSMEDALEQAGIAMIFSTARQNMYNIEGNPRVTVNDMVNLYNAHSPIGYPSTELEKGGAPTVDTLAQIFYEEAVAENIRPEVAWSQTMLETGWLKFGGQVQIHQFNFAGLGATDGGAKGADFSGYGAEAARMGVRAQIQHLKAYASSSVTEGTLKNPCVDGRFHLVRKGAAPYVEILGQKENPLGVGWATGENYGYKILSIINSMVDVYNTPLEVQLDVSKNTPQVYGTNITIRAIASGGSGKYQYKFYKNNEVTGGIFVLQDYSDNNSIIWNGMPEGMHTLYVDVKEIVTGEIVTKQMNFEIVSKELRATLYTSKESPQTYGTNVTLTVTASGGSGSYEYKFYKNNEVTGGLWVMQDYSAKNSVVWNGMPEGEHTLYVDVRDKITGKIQTEKKNFTIEEKSPLKATLKTSKTSPQVYGTNVTLTATASGGSGSYEYKFYKNNEVTGGLWVMQDYSAKNSVAWNGMPEGEHTLYVDVRDKITGKVVTDKQEFEIEELEKLKVSLKTSKESPQIYGTNVTLTATASGGSGSYEYKFYKNNEVTGGLWVMQDYSAKNSVVWNGMPAGEHTLYVDVKDELTGKIETVKKTFIITDLEAEFKTSKPSPQVYRTDIVLGATASGGSGNYEYKFYKNNEVTGGIYILQNYSTKSNVSWNAIPEGLHTLYVDVRDKTTGRVVTKQKEFVVNPSPTPLVKKFDTNVPSPQKYGTPITITAEGVGGTGGYQYRFYKNNEVTGGIYVIQDYSEKNSVMWNGIPEGTHTLYVDIKDSSGQTVTESKTFVISNKKKIWIDAGHGGNDVGAVAHGRYERDDVLRLALEIERVLRQQGQEVYMSRRDVDSGYISSGLVSLRKRCADANVARVDAFVSVHRDAASASAKGYTVYTHNWNNPSNSIVNPYPNKDSGCVSLSNSINSELSKLSTLKSRGIKYGSAGGTDDYLVNKATNMPSCLLEMGFITNSGDNQLFDTYLKQHAKAISKGIMNSLGVTFDESKYTW